MVTTDEGFSEVREIKLNWMPNYKKALKKSKKERKPVLIYFTGSDWCGPCKKITPLLKFLSNKYSKLKIIKINIESEDNIADLYNIQSLPTLIFYHKSKQLSLELGCDEGASNIIRGVSNLIITNKLDKIEFSIFDFESKIKSSQSLKKSLINQIF